VGASRSPFEKVAPGGGRDHVIGMDYASRRCVPCEGGVPKMTPDEVERALRSVGGWDAQEGSTRIHRHYRFGDFAEAMRFVNALAAIAEAEGHHPDFAVHYSTVDVTLWTHAIGGLSDNDFIVAAKLDRIPASPHGPLSTLRAERGEIEKARS
jgi:4a-hydroxytetrahydrobiopterin dehydratase